MTRWVLLGQGAVVATILSAKQKVHIYPLKTSILALRSLIKYKGLALVTSTEADLFPNPERNAQTKRTYMSRRQKLAGRSMLKSSAKVWGLMRDEKMGLGI